MTGRWTELDVPDQTGRTAVVTGANTGVGFRVATVLAQRGAVVVLACRDRTRAEAAADRIRATAPHAEIACAELDLASLSSVRAAAEALRSRYRQIDMLINNAGVMWQPQGRTADGFETHFGVNHLGHFALTGLLLDRILAATGSRIVTVSSPAHKQGRIDFDDLRSERRYRHVAAYAQSKLANLMFGYELHRRLQENSAPTISLAAHPGGARSDLNRNMPRIFRNKLWGPALLITHSVDKGALPILRAATDPAARGGQYYGPDGWNEFKGYPTLLTSTELSRDTEIQRRLWQESERLTGVTYAFADTATQVL